MTVFAKGSFLVLKPAPFSLSESEGNCPLESTAGIYS
jgi:hypothetical protein